MGRFIALCLFLANMKGLTMSYHFLVIDDSELNLKVTATVLQRLGICVDALTDVNQSYDYVSEKTYDIILMDYLMPGTDGVTATQHIRRMHGGAHTDDYYRDVPIILLTAEDNKALFANRTDLGISDILSKPCRTQDISALISKWCEKSSTPSIFGIDPDTMNEMYSADPHGFMEMLSIFADDISGKHERIDSALSAEDYMAYTVEVHRIKGEARMIGANALAEEAHALELAGKAITGVMDNGLNTDENIAVIIRDTPHVLDDLDKTGHDIATTLAEHSAAASQNVADSTAAAQASPNVDLEKLRRYLSHATEALDEQDYTLCHEWLEEIAHLIG